jgi:hypothetical protein
VNCYTGILGEMKLRASLLILLLLCADFVFIVLHIIIEIFDPRPSLCNISGICAYMNVYHLIKLFCVIILFGYIFVRTKCFSYASWLLMFTFFFFDDALLLHQSIGDHLANILDAYLSPGFGLPPRFFELAVLAITGLVLLIIVAWTYLYGSRTFKKISTDMLLFIAALVFFGLIVDVAEVLKLGTVIESGLGFVEDGGELVVDSLIVWYVFLLALHNGNPDIFLYELLTKPRNSAATAH